MRAKFSIEGSRSGFFEFSLLLRLQPFRTKVKQLKLTWQFTLKLQTSRIQHCPSQTSAMYAELSNLDSELLPRRTKPFACTLRGVRGGGGERCTQPGQLTSLTSQANVWIIMRWLLSFARTSGAADGFRLLVVLAFAAPMFRVLRV